MKVPLGFGGLWVSASLGMLLCLESVHSNHFASQLYSQASRDNHQRNLVVSPATTNLALGLVFFGMQHCPELTGVLDTMRPGELATEDIKMVNRLYVDRRVQLMPAYQEAISDERLGQPAKKVDFSEPQVVGEEIDSFVRIFTDNKVRQFTPPGHLDKDTRMAIANAAYFHGQWARPKQTKRLPFDTLGGGQQLVDTLESYEHLRYGRLDGLDARVLELPYEGERLSMVVILPRQAGQGLASLSSQLRDVDLVPLTQNLSKQFVHVRIPKFRVETRLPLESVLRPLGVRTIFHAPLMHQMVAGRSGRSHRINTIMHLSSVEVSESGSGYSPLATFQRLYTEPVQFWANHPFVFAIKDANHIYFMGHVVAPQ
ncbi:serine protease inhibitor 42Dd-like [Drosophila pseudoobscura]|uniref:Serine protease inhibitor 42Dd-like n=1 Tax=Drosophila pseudoobscura pseudoobscura TaxID=46245 RepID=A0A6I8V4T6_DROPS|nr:serine protease inhibitor 42Dd [Drosophila pseudoobscura]